MTRTWLVACLFVWACGSPPTPDRRGNPPVTTPRAPSCDFDMVELGTFLESSCSPRFTDRRAVGLLIRMPDRAALPAGGEGRLPLCAAVQLKAAEFEIYRHAFDPAHVVVVDDQRGETFSGRLLWENRTFRDPPPLDLSPEEKQIVTVTKFYNVNLLNCVKLPRRSAAYHVYVTLNAHKSNVCAVAVEVR